MVMDINTKEAHTFENVIFIVYAEYIFVLISDKEMNMLADKE